MQVEIIYRQDNGAETILGTRNLDVMPPTGEPFTVDNRQYMAKGYAGPDDQGRYRLFLEDDADATRH